MLDIIVVVIWYLMHGSPSVLISNLHYDLDHCPESHVIFNNIDMRIKIDKMAT